jgi:hypothetical protein
MDPARAVPLAAALVALAAPGAAQSFNVDCGPLPVPAAGYGAVAGQAGHWNQLMMPSPPVGLLGLAGEATGVVANMTADCDSYLCCDTPACTGFVGDADEWALLGSWMNGDCSLAFHSVTLTGLAPGAYLGHFYTYGCQPHSGPNNASVTVLTSGQQEGASFQYGVFQGDFTSFHETIAFQVLPNANVTIRFWGGSETGLAGIQLVQLDPVGLATCLGDGTGAPCPCGNSGLPGHGCRNSASIRGAELEAFGAPSLAADTLALTSTFEPPSVTSIVLQGDQPIAPAVFGDGLRCVGGNLKRLYTKSATSLGNLFAPPHGSPSISARSAQLGDPLQAGATRGYQVYYRDPSPTFCPEPQGSTFNVSNAVEVFWNP